MSTKFPDNIQTFGRFQDMTYNDWEMLSQYRQAMADSDFATAQQALRGISKLKNKLLTNGFMNDMLDTCYAVQDFFDNRQVPDYVVSMVEPSWQKNGDLWFELPQISSNNYLTFSSPKPFTISSAWGQKSWDGEIHYSLDTKKWLLWNGETKLASNTENKIYVRGINNTAISNTKNILSQSTLILNGENISCDGNLSSLLNFNDDSYGYKGTLAVYAFAFLFSGNSALVSAPEFPLANKISGSSCAGTFMNTSIVKAPDIPFRIVGDSGCQKMFYGCKNLTRAPKMSTVYISHNAFRDMFNGCINLETLPKILAESDETDGFAGMFRDCKKIKLSLEKTGEYVNEFAIPYNKNGEYQHSDALYDMFTGTGGTFAGTPKINTTYYTSNEVI